MKLSTLYYFIISVPSKNTVPPIVLEEVSMFSFPEISDYLNSEEETVRDSLVNEIIAKIKS